MVDSPTIKPINKGVVHKICAGQVILDLSSAVKELVENSLDAGATTIEISLKDYGEDWFQVIDNGCGIAPLNFKVLALKHHTSKLAEFPDLQSLVTFGFRGEALSSLCALGDLTVETRTKNESVATHLTFDHSGLLVSEKKTARKVGTTVTVKKLFSNLPVRSKEFRRNIRKEYGKLISLLNAYALIAKGVRLVCSNMSGKTARSVALKTQGSESLKDNIISLFGMSTYSNLEPLSMSISENCKVEGFISKSGYGSGRNMGDRQFFYVNGRPVDMPKVSKLVNELYRSANSRQFPIAILNFTVPTVAYDVNVTPDKRKIFFSDEVSILDSIRVSLGKIYSASSISYTVQNLEVPDKKDDDNSSSFHVVSPQISESPYSKIAQSAAVLGEKQTAEDTITADAAEKIKHRSSSVEDQHKDTVRTIGRDFSLKVHNIKEYSYSVGRGDKVYSISNDPQYRKETGKNVAVSNISTYKSGCVQSSIRNFVEVQKRKHESLSAPLSEAPILRNVSANCNLEVNVSDISSDLDECEPSKHLKTDNSQAGSPLPSDADVVDLATEDMEFVEQGLSFTKEATQNDSCIVTMQNEPEDQHLRAHPITPMEDTKTSPASKVLSTLEFHAKDLMERRKKRLSLLRSTSNASIRSTTERCYGAATLALSQPDNEELKAKSLDAATTELERLFSKRDFRRMKVVGQFNLGFIIGKLDEDLFIVDQHAADEKYNFELLSRTTIMNQQPLLRPIGLELSPEEEIVASMHMDIIRKNGFSLEEDLHASPGNRFKLKAVPFSKNITFGVEDVKELISTLSDSQGECSMLTTYKMDTANSICPSRVRGMLASRACRSSIMVGDALGMNEMHKILEHLSELKSPWNCPHGRPTMRHLVNLDVIRRRVNPENDSF